jgi:hypothetical protein
MEGSEDLKYALIVAGLAANLEEAEQVIQEESIHEFDSAVDFVEEWLEHLVENGHLMEYLNGFLDPRQIAESMLRNQALVEIKFKGSCRWVLHQEG